MWTFPKFRSRNTRIEQITLVLVCVAIAFPMIIISLSSHIHNIILGGDAPPFPPYLDAFSRSNEDTSRGLVQFGTGGLMAALQNESPLMVLGEDAERGVLGHKSTMLLGIFSTSGPKYATRRSVIRDTYLSVDDPRLCNLGEYKRQVQENPNNVVCQLPYTFVIGAGDSSRPYDHDDHKPLTVPEADLIDHNIDIEDDCTYLNIKENMEDGKSPTYLKFGADLSKSLNIDYIAKIDDDSVLAVNVVLELLDKELPPAPYNRRHYGGASWASLSKSLMYAAGQFYFMSSDLANYVGNSLSGEQRLSLMHSRHTEDADIGAFVFSHPQPVKFINLMTYAFWHHPRKDVKSFKESWEKDMAQFPRLNKRGNLLLSHFCPTWLSEGKGQI